MWLTKGVGYTEIPVLGGTAEGPQLALPVQFYQATSNVYATFTIPPLPNPGYVLVQTNDNLVLGTGAFYSASYDSFQGGPALVNNSGQVANLVGGPDAIVQGGLDKIFYQFTGPFTANVGGIQGFDGIVDYYKSNDGPTDFVGRNFSGGVIYDPRPNGNTSTIGPMSGSGYDEVQLTYDGLELGDLQVMADDDAEEVNLINYSGEPIFITEAGGFSIDPPVEIGGGESYPIGVVGRYPDWQFAAYFDLNDLYYVNTRNSDATWGTFSDNLSVTFDNDSTVEELRGITIPAGGEVLTKTDLPSNHPNYVNSGTLLLPTQVQFGPGPVPPASSSTTVDKVTLDITRGMDQPTLPYYCVTGSANNTIDNGYLPRVVGVDAAARTVTFASEPTKLVTDSTSYQNQFRIGFAYNSIGGSATANRDLGPWCETLFTVASISGNVVTVNEDTTSFTTNAQNINNEAATISDDYYGDNDRILWGDYLAAAVARRDAALAAYLPQDFITFDDTRYAGGAFGGETSSEGMMGGRHVLTLRPGRWYAFGMAVSTFNSLNLGTSQVSIRGLDSPNAFFSFGSSADSLNWTFNYGGNNPVLGTFYGYVTEPTLIAINGAAENNTGSGVNGGGFKTGMCGGAYGNLVTTGSVNRTIYDISVTNDNWYDIASAPGSIGHPTVYPQRATAALFTGSDRVFSGTIGWNAQRADNMDLYVPMVNNNTGKLIRFDSNTEDSLPSGESRLYFGGLTYDVADMNARGAMGSVYIRNDALGGDSGWDTSQFNGTIIND